MKKLFLDCILFVLIITFFRGILKITGKIDYKTIWRDIRNSPAKTTVNKPIK